MHNQNLCTTSHERKQNEPGGVIADARNDCGGKAASPWVEYEYDQHLSKEAPKIITLAPLLLTFFCASVSSLLT